MTAQNVTHVVVRLPLTDAQIQKIKEVASEIAENDFRFHHHFTAACDDLARAIGTPVEACGLETAAWGLEGDMQPGRSFIAWPRPPCSIDAWNIALVRRADAEAQIAVLRAENARLISERNRIAQETREACARICEQQRDDFADPQYAGGEMGAFQERFACAECAAAIRSAGEKA
ncbi:hypothetical protein JUN65_08375 [Gluconacetobacter azotocaptans]|uniref:hypothetical protein n=1 Tax=Gluconacetobacter azotocaptans TaxID=142834 RepID=UPI00195BA071|nr:hypothetical protein [Gluconacetobacter azotocaptans]MBM9401601.1 hypothetical protein [Gluconacetobacter azotocaptans]